MRTVRFVNECGAAANRRVILSCLVGGLFYFSKRYPVFLVGGLLLWFKIVSSVELSRLGLTLRDSSQKCSFVISASPSKLARFLNFSSSVVFCASNVSRWGGDLSWRFSRTSAWCGDQCRDARSWNLQQDVKWRNENQWDKEILWIFDTPVRTHYAFFCFDTEKPARHIFELNFHCWRMLL